ncbi:uncharacterized protein [Haliotis cracherodii]|uniref:uncharacterized protein n=1 Tax=Haliotis cracherodii TaxID=6455 RepID=UPI0039EA8A85
MVINELVPQMTVLIDLCHKWKLQMRQSSEMDVSILLAASLSVCTAAFSISESKFVKQFSETNPPVSQDKSFAFSCVWRCASSSTCRATNVLFAQKKCTYYTFEDLENLSGFDDVLYRKTYPPIPECQNGGTWSDTTKTSCDCLVSFTGTYCERYWDDCSEGVKMGISSDGVYTIQPRPYETPFQVHCRMVWGGRTTVQKQSLGIDFYRTWQEYRDGFGTPGGDHWLGLEKLKAISDKTPSKLILKLTYETEQSPTWRQIIYNYFNLSDELDGFRFDFISTKVPPNNAFSEAMTDLRGARFSTKDRDNDEDPNGSCSQKHHSVFQDKSFAFSCVGRCASSSTCRATNVLFAQRKCTYYTFEDLENLSGFDDVRYRKTYPPPPVCQNGGIWSDTTKTSCDCPVSFTGTYCDRYWDDCSEGFKMGISSDGVYTIQPRPYGTPFQVHCKMKYGGRTSVQKQVSGIDFYRTWQEYRDGFGTPGGDHWLGLEKMKAISDLTPSKLILKLIYDTDLSPTLRQIIYNYFNLSDAPDGFRLNFRDTSKPSNNPINDVIIDLRGARFSTKDRDNDEDTAGSCSLV